MLHAKLGICSYFFLTCGHILHWYFRPLVVVVVADAALPVEPLPPPLPFIEPALPEPILAVAALIGCGTTSILLPLLLLDTEVGAPFPAAVVTAGGEDDAEELLRP